METHDEKYQKEEQPLDEMKTKQS